MSRSKALDSPGHAKMITSFQEWFDGGAQKKPAAAAIKTTRGSRRSLKNVAALPDGDHNKREQPPKVKLTDKELLAQLVGKSSRKLGLLSTCVLKIRTQLKSTEVTRPLLKMIKTRYTDGEKLRKDINKLQAEGTDIKHMAKAKLTIKEFQKWATITSENIKQASAFMPKKPKKTKGGE